MERQLLLDRLYPPPVKRRSTRRRTRKRLTPEVKSAVLRYWMTQRMLKPFLLNAETWQWNEGSDIADRSGHDVEEGSAFLDNLNASADLEAAIEIGKRRGLFAKDMINALYDQTRQMAYRLNDTTGWTAGYFGFVVDLVIAKYPRDRKYGEELKRKALNKSMLV